MDLVSRLEDALGPFAHAGPAGLTALAALAGLSLASWAVFMARLRWLRAARRGDEAFALAFDAAPRPEDPELGPLAPRGPLSSLFEAGRAEMLRVARRDSLVKRVEGALGAEAERIRHEAGRGLAVLATAANLAPFVGLFGTVVGIVSAFARIAAASEASLSVVAGPISEALAATAVGLGVALPAAAGHALLARQVAALDARVAAFQQRFAVALRRSAPPARRAARAGEGTTSQAAAP